MSVARLEIVDKWGQAVAERGFSQVPNYLVLINQFVDQEDRLPPIEMIALIQLVSVWWKKDEAPFPSLKTLANRSGVSERQMQRAINSLEAKNLIKRERKKTRGIISTNTYNMQPLVDVLNEISNVYDNPFKRTLAKERREKQRKAGIKIKLGKQKEEAKGNLENAEL